MASTKKLAALLGLVFSILCIILTTVILTRKHSDSKGGKVIHTFSEKKKQWIVQDEKRDSHDH